MKPILEEFRELVGIDCASGKERMLADVLKRKLEALGFTVREDEAGRTFGGDTGNLIAILPGTRGRDPSCFAAIWTGSRTAMASRLGKRTACCILEVIRFSLPTM